MASLSKKRKAVEAALDKNKVYSLAEAAKVVKEINCTKFDSSVDVHIRLLVKLKRY
jgi:large subunit ribosomal protein L1